MTAMRSRFFKGWIPIHRISVLANLHGGAARFCTIVSGRSWSILLVRRDRSMPAVPVAERLTMREAIEQADGPPVPSPEETPVTRAGEAPTLDHP